MNRNEIIGLIESIRQDHVKIGLKEWKGVAKDDLYNHFERDFMQYPEDEVKFDEDKYDIEVVHSVGGYEGGGEDIVRVIHLVDKKNNKEAYIQYEGWYASYHGTEFECGINDFTIVEPKEVVVTQYFGVSE